MISVLLCYYHHTNYVDFYSAQCSQLEDVARSPLNQADPLIIKLFTSEFLRSQTFESNTKAQMGKCLQIPVIITRTIIVPVSD